MKIKIKSIVAVMLAAPLVALAQSVTIVNLGVAQAPGSYFSLGSAINNGGTVVGSSGPHFPAPAFVWEDGAMTTPYPGAGSSIVYSDINDSGVIAGNQLFSDSSGYAMIVKDGQIINLGVLGGGYSSAIAINNSSQVVGVSSYKPGTVAPTNGFLWSNGKMSNLGNILPTSISDSGVIAGYKLINGVPQAVSLNGSVPKYLENLPGDDQSVANAINSHNSVVGTSYYVQSGSLGLPVTHATLWENGVATSLIANQNIWSQANDINDRGQVVGDLRRVSPHGGFIDSAFLWENGSTIDLDELVSKAFVGWHVRSAVAINNQGQILALGSYSYSEINSLDMHTNNLAMLISVSSVPEPTTQAMLAIGLVALTRLRRSKH